MALGDGEKDEQEHGHGYREYRANEEFPSNIMQAMLALGIWLGAIHFNVVLVFFSVVFLPLSKSLV